MKKMNNSQPAIEKVSATKFSETFFFYKRDKVMFMT